MRFNTPTAGRDKTTNYEGELAYTITPELELYTAVCTASLQHKFYETSGESMERIRALIGKVSPEYVAKLAVYAREEMYLRSVPTVLTAELARIHSGDNVVSSMAERIIQRPDEITELLAYYQYINNRAGTKKLNKLSKQLQKGIAKSFHKFDTYQLGKYNRATEITLRDALFLTHPKPENEEEKERFEQLINSTLPIPYTWETRLSEAGKSPIHKKQIWEELIDSKKVGYMATMRNLRNILDAGVSLQHIQKVAIFLSNPNAIRISKQFPFRYLSAYRELQENKSPYTSTILNALEDAILISAENIEGYDYNTSVLLACDVSFSMEHSISPKSKVQYYDIGLVLAMLLQNRCKTCITGIFGDRWATKQLPQRAILQNVIELYKIGGEVGYSTNGYKVLEYLINNNIMVDKIMMFTDCEMWDSERASGGGSMTNNWTRYKKINPSAKLYLFDLSGYGNTPLKINDNDVYLIAGWSDKIFNILSGIERGESATKQINKIIV